MASVHYAIIDVFSETPYKGNPLAIVDTRNHQLTDTQMKLLTRQFNLSETTFFSPPTLPGAHYKLRSFLPDGKEVFGAGHNILGVWWYLAAEKFLDLEAPQRIDAQGTREFLFHQELGGEVIPVRITKNTDNLEIRVFIRQARPQAHTTHPDPAALAESFGLTADDIGFSLEDHSGSAKRLPPQVMSTSTTHHLLVPVSSVEALNRAVVQRDKLLEQLRLVDQRAYGLFLFTPIEASGGIHTFQARFFSPGMSGEDPATGSAAGPLSAYLHHHGVLRLENGTGRISVLQGLMIGRECTILVELTLNAGGFDVDIIGSGVSVAKGQIVLPGLDTTF